MGSTHSFITELSCVDFDVFPISFINTYGVLLSTRLNPKKDIVLETKSRVEDSCTVDL